MRHGIKSPRKTGTKTMNSGCKIRVLTAEAMSGDGAIILSDLIGKLDVPRVACEKTDVTVVMA